MLWKVFSVEHSGFEAERNAVFLSQPVTIDVDTTPELPSDSQYIKTNTTPLWVRLWVRIVLQQHGSW